MKTKQLDISHLWDADEPSSIKNLIITLNELEDRFGEDAIISFDAGYNNVSTRVKYVETKRT